MELVIDRIEDYLKQLEVSPDYGPIDDVRPHSELKELEGSYGLTYHIESGEPYKGRKKKFDDLLFVHGFAPNIRSAYFLQKKIIKYLDLARQNLTNSNIYFYSCRFSNKKGTPELNDTLGKWEVVLSFDIRWEEL